MRAYGRILGLIVAVGVATCTHDTTQPPVHLAPSPMIVSNVVTGTASAAVRRRVVLPSRTAYSASSASTPNVAYVSLLPNSAPGGVTAIISNARTHTVIQAPMLDGGLDPVPVPANTGDTIHIDVRNATGGTGPSFNKLVPGSHAPSVIRTVPGRGRTGVPLNKTIMIVFSEPVSESSLSSGGVQLLHAAAPVPGTAGVLAGVTAAAVFQPSGALEANTDYELVITRGVRDLDGEPLDSSIMIPFTTGTTTEGPVSTLIMAPGGSVQVRVGDEFQVVVMAMDASSNVLTGKPVTWYYGNPDVATVTATGLVTATGEGNGFIEAQVGGLYIALLVHVSNSLSAIGSVTLSVDTATIAVNDTVSISVVVRDADGNRVIRRVVQWATTNAPVARIVPKGNDQAVVTGVANGIAKIVATVDGTSVSAIVSVGPIPPVAGLSIGYDWDSLDVRETWQLTPMSRNSGGGRAPLAPSEVQWESSNPAVLTVSATGAITGVSGGTAAVTARWSGFTATTSFTVVQFALQNVSAGTLHTCGVTTGGVLYCWGADAMGEIGRPGILDFYLALPGQLYFPEPIPIAHELSAADVAVGGYFTCARSTTRAAYCWGYNGDGTLGNGTTATGWRPTPVLGGFAFTTIATGDTHACGLTESHDAYCWGSNRSGQLGVDAIASSPVPKLVQGGLKFSTLTVGGAHTCGLMTDGSAYCWGDNAAGQLGGGDGVTSSATPLPVSGGLTFASISAGESHTCGITTAAALYCWGWNLEGELGNGNAPSPSAVPSAVASSTAFIAISAGGTHSCAIDAAHDLWCWGQNLNGQLGLGPGGPTTAATPQRVSGGLAFAKVSLGGSHSCAATTSGTWYCWGKNDAGQLGVGNTRTDSAVPLEVVGQP